MFKSLTINIYNSQYKKNLFSNAYCPRRFFQATVWTSIQRVSLSLPVINPQFSHVLIHKYTSIKARRNIIKRSHPYYFSHKVALAFEQCSDLSLIHLSQRFLGICCIWSRLIRGHHSNHGCQFIHSLPCSSLRALVLLLSHTIYFSPQERDRGNITKSKREELICCVRYNNWYLYTLHRCWKLFC